MVNRPPNWDQKDWDRQDSDDQDLIVYELQRRHDVFTDLELVVLNRLKEREAKAPGAAHYLTWEQASVGLSWTTQGYLKQDGPRSFGIVKERWEELQRRVPPTP